MIWQPIETAPYGINVLGWLHLPKNPQASGLVIALRVFCAKDEDEALGEHRLTVGCWYANGRYYRVERFNEAGITGWLALPPKSKSANN